MLRNPDGIKRSTSNADNITAAVVLKDGVPVRTAVRQFGVSRTTLRRHCFFVGRLIILKIWNQIVHIIIDVLFGRCSLKMKSAFVQYLIVACNMHFGLTKQVKRLAFEYAKANGKNIPSPEMHIVKLMINGTLIF
ncbi:hypothetical protein TNIN_302461 [Trichonephila inaurata madagascariensis]|uniref:HTH psq-type domain-containing protein n=1 Tax=Trichonephila inaurata madagascariensis TaxID=2747483 RepID=A0A8X7CLJ4_9ARAC|nr:hypothetical protein TNIN_302461 [Trichonephila inaurata madagascariensis]